MKSKRSMRLVAALGALALVAAACGDGAADGGDFEPGPLGAVEVGPGQPIEIVSMNAVTGDAAFLGVPNDRAVQLAVEDYGDVLGHSVNVTTLDELCTADGGQSAAQTAVADEQVLGVIGTTCSGAAQAAAPLISDAGMVMISPSNTSPSLTSDLQGNPGENYFEGYHRTAHNDLFQGQAAANFVFNELGLTQVALIHDGDPYTNGLTLAFQSAFEELGGTIVVHTAVADKQTDMVPVLTEVASAEPELIFFPIFPEEGIPIVQQVGSVSGLEDVVLFGADGLSVDNFMVLPESEGMYFSGPDTRFEGTSNGVTGMTRDQFLSDYEAEFGEAPSADFWGHAYDATIMLLQAIENVAVQDGDTLFIDRQALRDELKATSGFEGVIGTLSCDDFGDCGSQEVVVFQHNNLDDFLASKANILYEFKGEVSG